MEISLNSKCSTWSQNKPWDLNLKHKNLYSSISMSCFDDFRLNILIWEKSPRLYFMLLFLLCFLFQWFDLVDFLIFYFFSRTSSISHEILGFDNDGRSVDYSTCNTAEVSQARLSPTSFRLGGSYFVKRMHFRTKIIT